MPFVFCLLVDWYLVKWVEKAVVNGAARVTARAAEKLAGAAEHLGERGQAIRDRATATAETLRGRPAPAEPRTRAGQRLADKTAHATGQALGGIMGWLRIMWADAKAAAEWATRGLGLGRPIDAFTTNLLIVRGRAFEQMNDAAGASRDYHDALVTTEALLDRSLEGNTP